MDNPSLIQLVMDKCGDIWLANNTNPMAENDRTSLHEQQFQSGSNRGGYFDTNNFFGGLNTPSMIVNMPESPLISGFSKDLQNYHGMLDDKSMKKYSANTSICGPHYNAKMPERIQPHHTTPCGLVLREDYHFFALVHTN